MRASRFASPASPQLLSLARIPLALAGLALIVASEPALAQQAANPADVSWAALDPGNDWAAQVVRSIFPIPGIAAAPSTGAATTIIPQIVGQFTGFVAAIACAFVVYTLLMHIHRAAESSRLLGPNQSSMYVVRVGFAAIMMFPLGGGFSVGQALVMQGAMTGIGMGRATYNYAVKAIGPDAIVVAQPMIPGTQHIVAGLIDSELCMDLINLASGTTTGDGGPLVPIPQPVTVSNANDGGYTSFRYSMSTGNQWGDPVCGTVTVRESLRNQTQVAGVTVDMAAVQKAVLTSVLESAIRNQVASVARTLWQTKQAAALVPLQDILINATNTYTSSLTATATSTASALNAAIQAQAQQARNGDTNLIQNQVQQSTLGWAAAGAYYLEIARMNASTLSLLAAVPVTSSPTYAGIGTALSLDLAPLAAAQKDFMTTLNYAVQTTDGTQAPNGVPRTLADAKEDPAGGGWLDRVFGTLNLSNAALAAITRYMLPTTQVWTDPFGGLMQLGQFLINTSLAGMVGSAVLSSTTSSTGLAIWNTLTFNWAGAAATIAGHAIMSFLATPILTALLSLLIPGLVIAYVLPMIPYVMWIAGVAGWVILVCEAMIAVPLWMLAHMTFGGDGLHGRAVEGWGLLFSVVFRPPLMVIGLFLGYFIFASLSWLIRMSFGIAAGFVLQNGWIVSNFIGLAVLLSIFVMMHVIAALMSFRLVAQLPHHLPRLIGFTGANRTDMDDYQNRAAWAVGGIVANKSNQALQGGATQLSEGLKTLRGRPPGLISGPSKAAGEAAAGAEGMDSTLRASTETSGEGEADV